MDDLGSRQAPIEAIRDGFEALRLRFINAAERHRILSAVLVEECPSSEPPQPPWPDLQATQGQHMLTLRGVRGMAPPRVYRADGSPAADEPVYLNAPGEPLKFADGSPAVIRYSGNRTYKVYGKQFSGSSPADYSTAIDEWQDAATEAGRLLSDSPLDVRKQVWRDCQSNVRGIRDGAADVWVNALFEIAYQRHPATRLTATRQTWRDNVTCEIEQLAALRSGGVPQFQPLKELVEAAGDSPHWFSTLPHLWRDSAAAIDLLLRWMPAVDAASGARPAAAVVEVNGGKIATNASGVEEPAQVEPEIDPANCLTLAQKKAWASWLMAESAHETRPKDHAAYDWLRENPEVYPGIPAFDTWQRQLRNARRAHGKQKNTPRTGRPTGGSVVRQSDI